MARANRRRDALGAAAVVGVAGVAVAGVVAAVLAIDHNDRHAHLAQGLWDLLLGDGGDGGDIGDPATPPPAKHRGR